MKKRLGLGVFLGAVVASAVLAASGGAAKPANSVNCSLSAGTTFTWTGGTARIDYTFYASDDTTQTGIGFIVPPNGGPGSGPNPPITTPANTAGIQVTFTAKNGVGGRTPITACTA